MAGVLFDFYGVLAKVQGDEEIEALLVKDFGQFLEASNCGKRVQISVELRRERPQLGVLPELTSTNIQERCTVYSCGQTRWVNYYNGQALSHWNFSNEHGTITTPDPDLLHELAYLVLLSRVGEIHDRKGMHRLHAVGLKAGDQAVLCMMPSGGGKTTLTLGALRNPEIEMLSDDTPIILRDGTVLAFPTRIGCCQPPEGIDPKHVWEFRRREHGRKYLISPEAFGSQVGRSAKPGVLMMGVRKLSGRGRIFRAKKSSVYAELFRSMVVGIGLPQLIEYFVRFDFVDMVRKTLLVGSRIWTSLNLIARSDTYIIELGPDLETNLEIFGEFLRRLPAKSGAKSSLYEVTSTSSL